MADNQQDQNKQVGGLAGLGAGVIAGAGLGTALIPIPVVGTFAGALLGGLFGSEIGKTVGGPLLDGLQTLGKGLSETVQGKPDDKK